MLNYSYWCKTSWSDCFVEVTGYCVLACAAMLDVFIYPENMTHPSVSLRTSSVNRMDVIGLIALMVVSIGKYQMHIDGISEYSNEQSDASMLEMPIGVVTHNDSGVQIRKKSGGARLIEKDYND